MARSPLSSRGWLNIALVAIVLALGALAWWRPGQEADEPEARVTALEADEIEHLTIERPEDDNIELQRSDGAWRLVAPRELEADTSRVERVIDVVEATSHARYPVADLDLGDFGLHHPESALVVGDTKLIFGATDPIDKRRYVRVGGHVHLIADHHFRALDRGWTGFVNRDLLPSDATIASIALPDVTVRRAEDGGWSVARGSQDTSPEAARRLVSAWRDARAIDVEAASDDAGSDAPAVTVTLEEPERTLTFHITTREPRLKLTRPDLGLVYHFTRRSAGDLLELTTPQSGAPSSDSPPPGDPADAPAP